MFRERLQRYWFILRRKLNPHNLFGGIFLFGILILFIVLGFECNLFGGKNLDLTVKPSLHTATEKSIKWSPCKNDLTTFPELMDEFDFVLSAVQYDNQQKESPINLSSEYKFSLREYNDKTRLYKDIVLAVRKRDGSIFSKTDGFFELCNEQNMTTSPLSTKIIKTARLSNNQSSQHVYLRNVAMPKTTGVFRMDTYFWIDGKWHFIARKERITIVE